MQNFIFMLFLQFYICIYKHKHIYIQKPAYLELCILFLPHSFYYFPSSILCICHKFTQWLVFHWKCYIRITLLLFNVCFISTFHILSNEISLFQFFSLTSLIFTSHVKKFLFASHAKCSFKYLLPSYNEFRSISIFFCVIGFMFNGA